MAYDVFLVASSADRDMAKLITRRLRALKMKVAYDAKNDDDVFTAREAAKLEKSDAVLVLWSAAGVTSDEVRAAASQGYSMKDQPLYQVTLDGTVPYAPFDAEPLHSLDGFTTRTNTDGWLATVEALEKQQGRKDLVAWLGMKASDKDGREAWMDSHPDDPITLAARKVKVADVAKKSVAATAGASAAPKPARETRPAATLVGAAGAGLAAARPSGGGTTTAVNYDEDIGGFGWSTLLWILAAIALMLLLSAFLRGENTRILASDRLPAIGNAQLVSANTCPAGYIRRSQLRQTLAPGPIIVDEDD